MVCATAAGPRISLSSSTSIWNSPPSFLTCSLSPIRTSREGLTDCPLAWIRPSSQEWDARERVLKKRAAQSHLSMRTIHFRMRSWHTTIKNRGTSLRRIRASQSNNAKSRGRRGRVRCSLLGLEVVHAPGLASLARLPPCLSTFRTSAATLPRSSTSRK